MQQCVSSFIRPQPRISSMESPIQMLGILERAVNRARGSPLDHDKRSLYWLETQPAAMGKTQHSAIKFTSPGPCHTRMVAMFKFPGVPAQLADCSACCGLANQIQSAIACK
jgi:hypothetical protein